MFLKVYLQAHLNCFKTSMSDSACLLQLRKELSAIWSDRPRYAKVEAALIESGQW